MPHADRERELQISLATALRELDEARTDAANLRFVNDKARESLAAANARADAAEAARDELRGEAGMYKQRYFEKGAESQQWAAKAGASESALAAARRVLKFALYEEGYCEMTMADELVAAPLHHAPGCDNGPPHSCDCWVGNAWRAIAAPAAGRDPAIEDADAAWRDGEAHGRDK